MTVLALVAGLVLLVAIISVGLARGGRGQAAPGAHPPMAPFTDLQVRVRALLGENKPVLAVKEVRQATGLGLVDAKRIVDALKSGPLPEPLPYAPGGQGSVADRARTMRDSRRPRGRGLARPDRDRDVRGGRGALRLDPELVQASRSVTAWSTASGRSSWSQPWPAVLEDAVLTARDRGGQFRVQGALAVVDLPEQVLRPQVGLDGVAPHRAQHDRRHVGQARPARSSADTSS